MKRSWLKRTNPERRKTELERQFGDLAAFVRWEPCAVCGQWSDPAHVRARRNAGAWRKLADGRVVGNIVPFCREHHDQQGNIGIATFEQRHGLDLEDLAEKIGERCKAGEEPTLLAVPW